MLTLNKAILHDGIIPNSEPGEGYTTEAFNVPALFAAFQKDQWPNPNNPVAVENFTNMVVAEFERRWGVFADGSGGVVE